MWRKSFKEIYQFQQNEQSPLTWNHWTQKIPQYIDQYQFIEQSSLTVNHWTQKKPTTHGIGNAGSWFGQAYKCGRVKGLLFVYTMYLFDW
jgi:hypothetical protein